MEKAAFFAAIADGNELKLHDLLKKQPGLIASRYQGASPVLWACYHRRNAIARLLAGKVDLDIWEAASMDELPRLLSLLKMEPALMSLLSEDGYSPLHLAAFFGSVACLETLIFYGADVNMVADNDSAVTPLHSAVANAEQNGRLACVMALLAAGSKANARQQGGFTPLHTAVQRADPVVTQCLLAAGADASLAADDGRRPRDFFPTKNPA
ncbi:ankyrin repeat domain-containing protein [Gallaecimonas sp. GXIMD1310]|uniref:ankyrin repeat domain-containing protein n=1 Tax=Gallaecimonas sp. GXIMD1310 TaxID=3131926 RepID=UPI003248D0BA